MKQPFTLPPRQTWIDHTSVIQTDVDTLYGLLSDIANWPSWSPGLQSIELKKEGFAGPGSFFWMTVDAPVVKRLRMPVVVIQNDRDRIEWGGGGYGSVIRHYWDLKPVDSKSTVLRHVEYATGLLCLGTFFAAKHALYHDMRWHRAIEAKFNR